MPPHFSSALQVRAPPTLGVGTLQPSLRDFAFTIVMPSRGRLSPVMADLCMTAARSTQTSRFSMVMSRIRNWRAAALGPCCRVEIQQLQAYHDDDIVDRCDLITSTRVRPLEWRPWLRGGVTNSNSVRRSECSPRRSPKVIFAPFDVGRIVAIAVQLSARSGPDQARGWAGLKLEQIAGRCMLQRRYPAARIVPPTSQN